MTIIGCTGHQQMPLKAHEHADREMRRLLVSAESPVVGVSALAAGADQMFAAAVHDIGGLLHVIVPSDGYESTFSEAEHLRTYRRLLAEAASVVELPFPDPSEEAFFAAGQAVVDASQCLWAIWDGQPAKGLGGSADVVRYARSRGKPVQVIWPPGTRR